MTTPLRIEQGEPRPWVEAGWGPNPMNATFYAVACKHCGEGEWMYRVGVMRDPGWVKRMVDKHNACEPRAGELDPWLPGTP